MKKKIILSLLLVTLLALAIFAYFYFSDRMIIENSKYNYQAYSITQTDSSVILTHYEPMSNPIKLVITYHYSEGEFTKATIENHYSNRLEAKKEYTKLTKLNNTTKIKDNIVTCDASDSDELAGIARDELVQMIEKPYIAIETYKKVNE